MEKPERSGGGPEKETEKDSGMQTREQKSREINGLGDAPFKDGGWDSLPDEGEGKEPRTVILQVEPGGEKDYDVIDLVSVAGSMGRKRRLYGYLLVVAVCLGMAAAVASLWVQSLFGGKSCATAVIHFSFDGIDEGRDPSGGLFDVAKLKSTVVINDALKELGWEDEDVEEIRSNLKLEGVIPDSVKQQIAVINTVAEDAVEYYTTIEDLSYFPSQYTVTLYRCRGMSGEDTRELLDAILMSYRKYFMDAYANTEVLGLTTEALDIRAYDYLQAADMIENEIDTIQDYVKAKAAEAPDFRANATGLSFNDLSQAIDAMRRLDLSNFVSFVQANNLTRDAGVQIDYYNYQIKQYNFDIQELQTQLSHVEKTIESYEKNPVIVMSSQESITETAQSDEYYNGLLQQKLELNRQISELNTDLNEAYTMINALNTEEQSSNEEDYAYADSLLDGLVGMAEEWGKLAQQTAEEYFEAELYADAYRISIPAQYSAFGSIGDLAKRMAVFGGAAAAAVVLFWGISGLKEEVLKGNGSRRDDKYIKQGK
ncbi:MAG: hypothetical protein NC400_07980 [Clostridium sp.]|nr:hypothetical protein [Clostridium sp.]